jgi:6-pyruvoyltetrahydropterin/6-carboxytetrahydropterin synthase
MIDLARTVRFCVSFDQSAQARSPDGRHNTFAGWPTMVGIGAFYEIEFVCRGEPDPATGYMMNISTIDRAARMHVLPGIASAILNRPSLGPAKILRDAISAIQPSLNNSLICLRWRLTPYHSVLMNAQSMQEVLITQQFEFSAAHRLHVPALSAQRNQEIFGKCNNPNGHGHNYRLEPQVTVPLHDDELALTLPELERLVDEIVIQRFDHKHLNLDTAEFENVNPSVEHIAKVCYDLLREPISQAGGRLRCVSVWETEKTRCTYPALPGII